MTTTHRLSVLDLGSNSFHVLVADASPDGMVVPILREREMLHLGTVVEELGYIPQEQADRATAVVAHLSELARRSGATDQHAVATSALRDASNGADVVAAMSEASGCSIEVIDAEREARLAWLGVRASVALPDEPILVLDLGGGSLEFAAGPRNELAWTASADLGVSRLSTLMPSDPPSTAEVAAVSNRVRGALESLVVGIETQAPARIVAVGGTVRALARIIAAVDAIWLPATLNQFTIPVAEIAGMRDRLVKMTLNERIDLPGMKYRRADRIHVAATILAEVLDRLGFDEIMVSDWGLREGSILDALGVRTMPDGPTLRRRAVDQARRAFVPDDPHLPHVALLATRLFDATREVHGLDDDDRELLEHAAHLHDVGESLALRNHHRHGAYLVENAEIRGFSPKETALLATLVRFHKSRGLSTSYPPSAALDAGDRDRAVRLLSLLQVADGLDRARDQAVRDLSLEQTDGVLQLRLYGDGLHVAVAEVDRKTALFRRTFGVAIEVVKARG